MLRSGESEEKVHAVTLFWDLSATTVAALRNAGILVVCQVGSVSEAREATEAGADLLIAQGWEAGGHVRGRTGLSELLGDVVAAVDVPVLAAGGIVDGRGLASALRAGAQGAVIGTAFLATDESYAHDYHKKRIVEAGPDETLDTKVFHINWPKDAVVRVLPNSVTRGERGDPFAEKRWPIGADGARPIYLFSTDAGREFCPQQRRLGGGRDQVHAENPPRAAAHLGDLGADGFGALAHHAEKAEPARLGHRRDQFGARDPAHARQHYRLVAAKEIADRSVEIHRLGLGSSNAFMLRHDIPTPSD
jgi:Nitronate monooxygenase